MEVPLILHKMVQDHHAERRVQACLLDYAGKQAVKLLYWQLTLLTQLPPDLVKLLQAEVNTWQDQVWPAHSVIQNMPETSIRQALP